MKLRNKKTGKIEDLSIYGITVGIRKEKQPFYHSIAELNAEWEDYEPKEPLIKDEKIRKAVRAWAEATCSTTLRVPSNFREFWGRRGLFIEFDHDDECDAEYETYTIAELCGEEE